MGLAQSGLPEETPLYALDKYVQLQRVCFLSAFDLEKVIDIDHIVREIGLVFFFFFSVWFGIKLVSHTYQELNALHQNSALTLCLCSYLA